MNSRHSKTDTPCLRVKICGLMQADQAIAIAAAGADAIGFICVPESPRYLVPSAIRAILQVLPDSTLQDQPLAKIGVFANATLPQILDTVAQSGLNGIQLHGQESPQFCYALRQALPGVELIKAFRVKDAQTLLEIDSYAEVVDTYLLDAYAKSALGGTGESWSWKLVQDFHPQRPWLLAGGLTPSNIGKALQQACPCGIDLSSGVERSPGDKDLDRVRDLFRYLALNP